jgi:hypothetical protein
MLEIDLASQDGEALKLVYVFLWREIHIDSNNTYNGSKRTKEQFCALAEA